jgi:hypothetical protein
VSRKKERLYEIVKKESLSEKKIRLSHLKYFIFIFVAIAFGFFISGYLLTPQTPVVHHPEQISKPAVVSNVSIYPNDTIGSIFVREFGIKAFNDLFGLVFIIVFIAIFISFFKLIFTRYY